MALNDFYIGTIVEAIPGDVALGLKTTNTFVIPDDGWLIEFRFELDYPQKSKKTWKSGDEDGSGAPIADYSANGTQFRPDLETSQFLQVAIAKKSNPLAFKPMQDEEGIELRATCSTGRDLTPYNVIGNMPAGVLDDSITETPSWSFNPGQVTTHDKDGVLLPGGPYVSGYKVPTNAVGLPTVGNKVSRGDRIRFWCGTVAPSYVTSQDQWYAPRKDPYYAGALANPDGSTVLKKGGLNDLFYYARFTRVDPALAAPEAEAEPTFTTTGAFGGVDLAAIESAIKSGELRVQYNDRMVVYRSIQELLAARDFIKSEIAAPATTSARVAKQVRFATKRGYGT